MFGFLPLASGSKGNCLFVGSQTTRVLIDAGLSCTAILQRLAEASIDPHTIQAILITHEHSDHIQGLPLLARKLGVPVLANADTAKGIYAALGERPKFKIFTTGETFQFGDLVVHPFSVPHDTLDPVAFTIQTGGIKLGICTDLGHATSLIKKQLERCDFLYLEANHDPSMVHASNRPAMLKQRILGKSGHLSNEQCAELLIAVFHPGLKHVHLAHLSSECNAEERALAVVSEALKAKQLSVELSIAYQDRSAKAILF
ncbi:MAG: MBL fold metallo-hydrolase [Verrucomicrobia bacterium]|nr:MBL fold metallo-hydrolase [Verrucomicrobiota bacterium]MBU6445768.1 MBL fold metallo-hydrolase [Verrucomicrobiota bacterium]MDE3047897.1 MBL fold metallo-hydrolase [Verrucomicrobiota bacterium]